MILMLLFFVETLEMILLCFLNKTRSCQSDCASNVARTFISAFHRPCFTAPCFFIEVHYILLLLWDISLWKIFKYHTCLATVHNWFLVQYSWIESLFKDVSLVNVFTRDVQFRNFKFYNELDNKWFSLAASMVNFWKIACSKWSYKLAHTF